MTETHYRKKSLRWTEDDLELGWFLVLFSSVSMFRTVFRVRCKLHGDRSLKRLPVDPIRGLGEEDRSGLKIRNKILRKTDENKREDLSWC